MQSGNLPNTHYRANAGFRQSTFLKRLQKTLTLVFEELTKSPHALQ